MLGLFLIFWPAVQCNSGILYLLTFFASLKNYEVRRYPAAKWACTKEYEVDPLKDPMKDWEEKVSWKIISPILSCLVIFFLKMSSRSSIQ